MQKTLKVVALHDPRIVEMASLKGKGRPRKGRTPNAVSYGIEVGIAPYTKRGAAKFSRKAVLFSPPMNWTSLNSATKRCWSTIPLANKKSNVVFAF